MDPTVLRHPEGDVEIHELPDGRRRIEVDLFEPSTFMEQSRWTTAYPVAMIELALKVKGPAWLCDEIMREEDPHYIRGPMEKAVLGYIPEDELAGKRILDFGCGSGASTVILSSMFPESEIVGIDLDSDFLSLADARAGHYGCRNTEFVLSQDPKHLPERIGRFDIVVFSALFEHLLPDERRDLFSQVWSVLQPGGILFLNSTPHRYWPIENHTTGLPLINYLPDNLALRFARRFSRQIRGDEGWDELLRKGIRGGTDREIVNLLDRIDQSHPVLLEPNRLSMRDRIDLWHSISSPRNKAGMKFLLKYVLKGLRMFTGVTFVPRLSLALKKAN